MKNGELVVEELMDYINQTDFTIRNGMGLGFIVQPELFNNRRLEVGIGRSHSDAENVSDFVYTSPIKIIIDANYNVIDFSFDSFPNSKESIKLEKLCVKWIGNDIPTKLLMDKQSNLFERLFGIITNKLGVLEHIGINDNYKLS